MNRVPERSEVGRRALWVTAIEPCYDAGGGGQIRQAHLLQALGARFETHLLLAGRLHDERVRRDLKSVTEVVVPPLPEPSNRTARRLRDLRWQLLQREPDEVARARSTRDALRPSLASLGAFDLVCVEYIGLADLLPTSRDGFWAITLHNLTSAMARHNQTIAPGRRQRAMLSLEERNSRRLERRALDAYDLVVAVSSEDAAALGGAAEVVPNGVDVARFVPSAIPQAPRVVFTGALHTLPNRDGLMWFCQEVWPRVRERIPEASLEIVGSTPSSDVRELAAIEAVTVHPDVPDTRPFLARARAAVVPLRIGSGSRLKALEAMAAGRPVVGTRIGLGGLDVEPGREVLLADTAPTFAQALVSCLLDHDLAARLAENGRSTAVSRYAWSEIGAAYVELLEDRLRRAETR